MNVKDQNELEELMAELSSAEDFLNFFSIKFDQSIVQINRLHIMQRYHDYLNGEEYTSLPDMPANDQFHIYKTLLLKAYTDFVHSNAQKEKVLSVFKKHDEKTKLVTIDK
jgi:nitrogenase-stabilizing/protective protein